MPRAKQARGEDTKSRILDAALRVYARGNANDLNVHAIVAESGASLGSIYHHFGNMDGLAAALYARCMVGLLESISQALIGVRTARSGTLALVRAYLDFARTEPAAARFIHASAYASFLPAHAATVAAAKLEPLERIRAFFRAHVQAGRIVNLSDEWLEMLLIGPVAEVTRRHLAGAVVDLEEAGSVLGPRIWRSVRRASAGVNARKPRRQSHSFVRAMKPSGRLPST